MHHDEANLALNMMGHSYLGFFIPLDRNQVCPPFFLIFSKLIYNLVKFNYNAEFSDMLLKFFPLVSGITTLFLFPVLLNSIFANKLLNILGTLFLALNKVAIFYSCVFKQYSFEMLLAVILMNIVYNLKFNNENFYRNILIFLIIGFCPLFSYSSCFIIAGISFYLVYLFFTLKKKEFLIYLSVMCIPLFFILLIVALPLYINTKSYMNAYWNKEFGLHFAEYIKIFFSQIFSESNFNFLYFGVAFVVFCAVMLKKNIKLFFIVAVPFIVTYLISYYSLYPAEDRLLLFIFPAFIINLFFIFSLFKFIKSDIINLILFIPVMFYLGFFISNPPALDDLILKPDVARDVWEYFEKIYDKKTVVIFAGSKNSQMYYSKFFPVKRSSYVLDSTNWYELYNNISPGTYYIISDYSKSYNYLLKRRLLADTNILEYKFFISPWIKNKNKYGWYMKFEKE